MILSDASLLQALRSGSLVVDPLFPDAIQPASIDLRLSPQLRRFRPHAYPIADRRNLPDDLTEEFTIRQVYYLQPGEFLLASTVERIELPSDLVGRVEGKSSLGRLGVLIHVTAGYIDPGWRGTVTLEVHNVGPLAVTLRPGDKICQLSLLHMTSPAVRPYGSEGLGSRYQNQNGPTGAKGER